MTPHDHRTIVPGWAGKHQHRLFDARNWWWDGSGFQKLIRCHDCQDHWWRPA